MEESMLKKVLLVVLAVVGRTDLGMAGRRSIRSALTADETGEVRRASLYVLEVPALISA